MIHHSEKIYVQEMVLFCFVFLSNIFQLRTNENEMLSKKVASGDPEKAEQLIFAALQQRHMRERVELEELFKNETEAARAYAKAHAEEVRQAEKENLLAQQDKVI